MSEQRQQYQKHYREKYKSQVKRVNLTFSNTEFRKLSSAAEKEKLKSTSYVKNLVMSGLENQANIPNDIIEELKTLRFAVHNIANNVNQLTHYSHRVRELTMSEENNLLQHLKQLDESIREYTKGRILESSHHKNNDH